MSTTSTMLRDLPAHKYASLCITLHTTNCSLTVSFRSLLSLVWFHSLTSLWNHTVSALEENIR